MNTAPRRALLLAALAAVRVKTQAPEFAILHAWLDSWSGLGLIVLGMHRHGYDLSLTHDRNGWRADLPPPEPRPIPMGRAGAVLVADAMASHPGGPLAGAEHAVRLRLLRHRRLAAVGWRPRGAIRVGSGGVTHGRLYRYPQSHAHCDSLRRDDERAWELRRDHSSVGHRPRMPRFGVRPAART